MQNTTIGNTTVSLPASMRRESQSRRSAHCSIARLRLRQTTWRCGIVVAHAEVILEERESSIVE